jgi:hypothetical protein
LRAVDREGFLSLLVAKLRVLPGPRNCEEASRFVLVVLDTDERALANDAIWPLSYRAIERSLIHYYFDGYRYQIHETERGVSPPDVGLLTCASSVFWFHSSEVDVDDSTLLQYHRDGENPLPSYIASGGNFFLCGIQPSNALKYFEGIAFPVPQLQPHPVLFSSTLDGEGSVPHWVATFLGIDRIEGTVGNTQGASQAPLRLRRASSRIVEPHPYPDLPFDPLTWPQGTLVRGFGYYDRGVIPLTGDPRFPDAESIYLFNDEEISIAVRRLSPEGPGVNGNTVYLGFHPYFLDRPLSRELIRAVLADFGESPLP